MTDEAPRTSNQLAADRTDMAADRTAMAADRTSMAARRTLMAAERNLMAWIRTALSMISFGFTIYKLLESFQHGGATLPNPDSPRNVGLLLTGLGTLSMLMGTMSYVAAVRDLRKIEPMRIWRASFAMSLIMSAFGLFLFFAIIARIL